MIKGHLLIQSLCINWDFVNIESHPYLKMKSTKNSADMAVLKCLKSLSSYAALLFLLLFALGLLTETAQAQSCTDQLSKLNSCASFVVPGASDTNPSSECCGALEAVGHDCLCNTIRIASSMPSKCNLPAISCGLN